MKRFLMMTCLLLASAPAALAQSGYSYSAGVPSSGATAVTPPPADVSQGYNQALQQLQQVQAQQQQQAQQQFQAQQQAVAVAPVTSAAPVVIDPSASAAPPDPCAAYQTQDGYALCQDRIKKLERMQNYRTGQVKAREDKEKARLEAIAAAAAKKAAGKTSAVPTEQAIGAPKNFAPAAPAPATPATTPAK